jgi:hypothetical protein
MIKRHIPIKSGPKEQQPTNPRHEDTKLNIQERRKII